MWRREEGNQQISWQSILNLAETVLRHMQYTVHVVYVYVHRGGWECCLVIINLLLVSDDSCYTAPHPGGNVVLCFVMLEYESLYTCFYFKAGFVGLIKISAVDTQICNRLVTFPGYRSSHQMHAGINSSPPVTLQWTNETKESIASCCFSSL